MESLNFDLHVASFHLPLAPTYPSALPVFEQPVLVLREGLAHLDELLLGDELDVDLEVAALNHVTIFVIRNLSVCGCALVVVWRIDDAFWKLGEERWGYLQFGIANPLPVSAFCGSRGLLYRFGDLFDLLAFGLGFALAF